MKGRKGRKHQTDERNGAIGDSSGCTMYLPQA